MLDLKHFSPDVLYAFAYQTTGAATSRLHHHSFPELSIVLEGQSEYHINNQWCHVSQGQAVLLNPGVEHQEYQAPDTHSYQLYVGFRHIALPGQAPDTLPFENWVLDLDAQRPLLLSLAQRIATENEHPEAFGHRLLVQAYVTEMLCLLMRTLPDNAVAADHVLKQAAGSDSQQAMITTALYYLDTHYSEAITMATLAAFLHVSEAHLSRSFKALKGQSPMAYLMQLRLSKARELLNEGHLSVKAVGQQVGYLDPFYFSRLYKRAYGVTPSSQKKQA